MNAKHGRNVASVSDAVLQMFNNFHWPGNVREMRNTLERAVIVCQGALIEPRHLPPNFGSSGIRATTNDGEGICLEVGTTVEQAAKMLILKTRGKSKNNKTRAS